jgi:hypothetical protein
MLPFGIRVFWLDIAISGGSGASIRWNRKRISRNRNEKTVRKLISGKNVLYGL